MASTAVMELTAPILVGAWVDRRYGSAPWGLVVGAVLGFVGGVSHLILMTRRMDRAERERAERERAKGPPA